MKRIGGGGIVGSGTPAPAPAYDQPTGFEDPGTALDVRDVIEDIAQDVYDGNQIFRRAVVTALPPGASHVTVEFVDEPGNTFNATISNIRPTAIGQQVEIEVRNGVEFYVNRIIGESEVIVPPPAPVPAPAQVATVTATGGIRQIVVEWSRVSGAEYYRVERSQDINFLPANTAVHAVDGSMLVVQPLVEDSVWFFRVAAVNETGPGPWSATTNATVGAEAPQSDGNPPADSPPVTVTEGLGYLFATWPPQANADRVTYEVYLDTLTGFAISASNKVAETDSTFYFAHKDAAGTKLAYGTRYFLRVRARDTDGPAPVAGAQGSGVPQKVELGDAGSIPTTSLVPDGNPPTVPGTPVVTSGIGYLYVKWAASSSVDDVTYDVHIATVSGFIPDANTLSLTTGSLFGFVRKQGPGALSADLVYGVTYYVKIVARDADGSSGASAQGSGATVKTNTADIAVGAITAGSAILGELAVDEAHIAGAAITRAKIRNAAIGTAEIEDGKITNAKIYDLQASKITTDLLTATLTVSGVIRTSSAAARVEMNSAGFFAYNSLGNPTVSINNDGSATFSGTVSGGAVNGATITGGTFQTASSGTRTVMDSDSIRPIRFYVGTSTYFASIRYFDAGDGHAGIQLADGKVVSGVGGSSTVTIGQNMIQLSTPVVIASNILRTAAGFECYGNIWSDNAGSTYGSVTLTGIKNGWAGVAFSRVGNNLTYMMSSNTSGVHDQTQGWRWYFSGPDGTAAGQWTLNAGYVPWGRVTGQPATGVSSVNGYTGAVSLNYSHVDAAWSGHGHTYPVTSVNGRTGAVSGLSESTHGHSYGNFSVSGYLQAAAGSGLYVGSHLQVNTSGAPTLFNNGGNTRIATQGNLDILYVQNKAATAYVEIFALKLTPQSSREGKEDIQNAPSALNIVKQMRPVTFRRKGRDTYERGLIAEEIQAIDPLLAVPMGVCDPNNPNEKPSLGLDLMGLAATALQAAKELATQVADLQTRVTRLERSTPQPA